MRCSRRGTHFSRRSEPAARITLLEIVGIEEAAADRSGPATTAGCGECDRGHDAEQHVPPRYRRGGSATILDPPGTCPEAGTTAPSPPETQRRPAPGSGTPRVTKPHDDMLIAEGAPRGDGGGDGKERSNVAGIRPCRGSTPCGGMPLERRQPHPPGFNNRLAQPLDARPRAVGLVQAEVLSGEGGGPPARYPDVRPAPWSLPHGWGGGGWGGGGGVGFWVVFGGHHAAEVT